jgi:uncharacterized MnhB-related membrane protein
MDWLIYAAFAAASVAVGGGIIGTGLVVVWFGLALIAWERTRREVAD